MIFIVNYKFIISKIKYSRFYLKGKKLINYLIINNCLLYQLHLSKTLFSDSFVKNKIRLMKLITKKNINKLTNDNLSPFSMIENM